MTRFDRHFGQIVTRSPHRPPPSLLAPCALALAFCAGCTPKASSSGPMAQSPERQAESETDLAVDALRAGRLHEALDHANKAVELDDSNAKSLYVTSLIYLGFCDAEGMKSPNCRLADSEKFARRALSADERLRDARNELGVVLTHEQKYAEAMKVLEPLTKDPSYESSSFAWGNYGWAQVLAGKVDDGITSLRNSITDPRFCTGHYRLGMAYEKKNDLLAAEKSFTDALGVGLAECANLQEAWFERGRVRMKLGHLPDAQADFARCRDISSDNDTGKECARLAGDATAAPMPAISPPSPSPGNPNPAPPANAGGPKAAASPVSGGAAAP